MQKDSPEDDEEEIPAQIDWSAIGIWGLRVVIAIGMVVCFCLGKDKGGYELSSLLVCSFIFL